MARTYTDLLYHLVFSTTGRQPLITPDLQSRLYPYLGGIAAELQGRALLINGTADHVHALVRLPPTVVLSDALRVFKTNSSRWVHQWPEGHPATGRLPSAAPTRRAWNGT